MKALEELTRSKETFDKKFETDGKAILEAGFADFFAANPGVAAVSWEQFTEDCDVENPIDGVGDPVFKLTDDAVASAGDEEEEENEDAEPGDGFVDIEDVADPAMRRAAKRLGAEMTGHDDLFLALFGFASQVTWTREGVEVEDLGEEE